MIVHSFPVCGEHCRRVPGNDPPGSPAEHRVTDHKPILKLKQRRVQPCTKARRGSQVYPKVELKRPPARKADAPKKTSEPEKAPKRDGEGELLAALRQAAPDVWDPAGPVPLAIRIHEQLFPVAESREISRSTVRRFLGKWTSAIGYLDALAQRDSFRRNADGSCAGNVSDQNRARARHRLHQRKATQAQSIG